METVLIPNEPAAGAVISERKYGDYARPFKRNLEAIFASLKSFWPLNFVMVN
jgi:hypothetical protein